MKILLTGSAVLLLAAAPARAQFPGDTPDNFRLRLGGIFANIDSTVKLSTPALPGTEVNLSDLGLAADHKTTFRGDGYWNFAGRSYLDFGYVDYTVSGSNTLTQDINVDGVIYKAGASVNTETRSRFIYGAYRYGIVRNEAVHLGLSLGVSYTTLRGTISATAGVTRPDGTIIVGGQTKEEEISAPVPLAGLDLEFRVAGPVTLGMRVRAVGANIDKYSGSWIEAAATLSWYLSRNFGVGGAYEYHKILVEKKSSGDEFRVDQRYEGPRAFLLLTF